jgi:diacylglycerol O-acyltransferase / wax synthase
VPVNVRGEDGAASLGNRISFISAGLPVADDDPIGVLRLVRAQTRARKEAGHAGPLDAIARAADLLPDGSRRAVARVIADAASFNAVISNVPGPPVPLTLLGRPLSAIFPAVPFLDGHALSICAISYGGRLQCGLYADAAVVPDAVDVAGDLEAAFVALREAPPRPRPPWQGRARIRRDLRLAREVTPTR